RSPPSRRPARRPASVGRAGAVPPGRSARRPVHGARPPARRGTARAGDLPAPCRRLATPVRWAPLPGRPGRGARAPRTAPGRRRGRVPLRVGTGRMSRAHDWLCPFLGRPADDFHHWSGRDADGTYFDGSLVVPVVRAQHTVEHVSWRAGGFGDGSSARPVVL